MLPVNMSNVRHKTLSSIENLGLNIKCNSDNETTCHFDSDGSVNLSADEQSSECE